MRCSHLGGPRRVWIVTDYADIIRDLLSLYKFGHQRAASLPIASKMAATFNFYHGEQNNDYTIVPVPTATSRIRERGFGHTELLAKGISKQLRFDYREVLRRLDQTRQLGSRRNDRLTQLASSFVIKSRAEIKGRNILLIDDVVTTGGTIIAATKALRDGGAKRVDALLLAKRL